ncbi:MAG: HYR domain-containing protein [Sphingobacteriales bacterium]|nr:HYR domain-containing protein [Sphingobacteriales bacterium]
MLNQQLPTRLERGFDSCSSILKRIVLITLLLQVLLGFTHQALAQSGSALQFDGTDDYVAVNNPFTSFQKEITVEWWVYIVPNQTYTLGSGIGQGTVGIDNMSNNVWLMHFNGSGSSMQFYVNDAGTWRTHAAVNIPSGWHHLAGVADANATRLFIDGALVASGQGITNGIWSNANAKMHFGKDVRFNAGRFMPGIMDEIRIWSRAICQGELQNNKFCEIPGAAPNLEGNYHFNQGTASANNASVTSLLDASGNNRHGALTNMGLTGSTSNWVTPGGIINGTNCAPFAYPTASITAGGSTSICMGGSVTLNANTNPNFTYQWKKNDINISGATAASYVATTAGNYSVTITNLGCSGTSNPTTVTVLTADADGDGISDACDLDDDNDGILDAVECNVSNFFWSNPPSVSGNVASGTINGIAYTYTSSSPIEVTSSVFAHHVFPASYAVPNVNPTIKNTQVTNNILNFASPMTNPVLVFSSIGGFNSVPITFSSPIEILWSTAVVQNSPTQITGTEGYAIIRLNGTFSSISFNYLQAENWCNFAFGADFTTCGDTDNDGILDFVDLDSDNDGCSDAVESGGAFLLSQTVNNRLTGGVNTQGIPLLAGSGQTNGTSKNASANCSCQANIDRILPSVFVNNVTVQLNASGTASVTAAQVNNGSTDACGIASVALSKTNFNCTNVGANTVTLTVTDNNGNIGTANATITVQDLILPTAIAQNITVSLDAAGNANITTAQVNNGSSDNCSIASFTLSKSTFTCSNAGANTVTLTVTDASGNSASANAVVTIIGTDTDSDGVADACDLDDDNDGITDAQECNKSNFYWSNPPASSGNTATGTINGIGYTYTSTSPIFTTSNVYNHGIFPSSYNVPNNNPTIRNDFASTNTLTFASPMKNPVLVFSSIGNGGLYVPIEFDQQIQVLWSTAVVQNSSTRITGNEGYTIIRLNGTFSSIGFRYLANESYVNFVFGADFTTCGDTDNDGTPDYADTDSDNDGCSDAIEGSLGFTQSQTANGRLTGAVNAQGIPVLAGAGQGNGTSQSFIANCFCQPTIDKTAPTVVTQNITVALSNLGTASITPSQINNGSTDNCSISSTTLSKTSFNCSNLGANTVTLTVRDINNNIATGTAIVTVVDNILPTISCGGNINSFATSSAGATINFPMPTGSDNCSYTITQTAGLSSGSIFPIGTTTVGYQISDASGNSATCSFNVNVTGLAPVIVSPGTTSANTDANSCTAVVNYAATETTGIPASTITYSIAPGSSFNVGTTQVTATATNVVGTSQTTFDVVVTDNILPTITCIASVNAFATSASGAAINYTTPTGSDNCTYTITQTAGLPSGSTFPIGTTTVSYQITDASGNTATCSFDVTITGLPPVIVSPGTITANADQNACSATVSFAATETTAIPASTITYSIAPGSTFNVGTTQVTATATNAVGTSQATFDVIVSDNTAPSALAQNLAIDLDALGNASITPGQINNGSSDACGIANISIDKTNFNCSNVGDNAVVLTVTDIHGNSSTANATVTVSDITAPVAIAQNLAIVLDASGSASISATQINNGSSDACGIADISIDKTNFNCTNVGANTVVLTVTDIHGNSSTANATVTVSDNTAPIIVSVVDQTKCFEATGNYTIENITASDNCSIASSSFVITGATTRTGSGLDASGAFNIGTSTITWTVIDPSNNSSTSSATFTVYPLPVASLVSSDNNTFCNEVTLTASSSLPGNTSYMWSTGETTQSIILGSLDADGQYFVYVTSEYGCNSAQPATYNYAKQNLVNSYTILVNNEVELKGTNTVQSGSVGVMKATGEAEFEKGVSIIAAGTFTKSPKYKLKNTVTIANKITGVANVGLPTMQTYTGNANNLPSYTVNKNTTVTLISNYKDLTVKKGANATINGSLFRKVTIEDGATVRFTSAVVNIEDLKVGTGSSNSITRVRFAGNTSIRIKDKVKIEGNCIVNQDNYIVTFYFASTSGCNEGDEDKFSVKGGNTTVTANVLIPGGKIKVENEGDDDDDDCHGSSNVGTSIYMTGLYVANNLKSEGKNIYWNSFNCSNPSSNRETIEVLETSNTDLFTMDLLVYPNPARQNFNFKVESMSVEKVTFRIFDVAGRIVFENTDGNANEVYNLGEQLTPGVYMIEAQQASERKVLRVVKTQ